MMTKSVLVGRVLSWLAIAFLLFDSIIHLMNIAPVVEAFHQLGYPESLAMPIGIIELVCIVFYVMPKTSVLGAVLLTGYLGGAVASQLRIGSPLFGTLLFPVYVGIILWLGLYLTDARVRSVMPFKKSA